MQGVEGATGCDVDVVEGEAEEIDAIVGWWRVPEYFLCPMSIFYLLINNFPFFFLIDAFEMK